MGIKINTDFWKKREPEKVHTHLTLYGIIIGANATIHLALQQYLFGIINTAMFLLYILTTISYYKYKKEQEANT